MEIYCVKEVAQNPVPKSQTKPFYIGTKDAPSDLVKENVTETQNNHNIRRMRFVSCNRRIKYVILRLYRSMQKASKWKAIFGRTDMLRLLQMFEW